MQTEIKMSMIDEHVPYSNLKKEEKQQNNPKINKTAITQQFSSKELLGLFRMAYFVQSLATLV